MKNQNRAGFYFKTYEAPFQSPFDRLFPIFKELISSLMNGNGISNITPQQIAKINKKIRQQMNSKRDDVEEKICEIPENQRFYVTTSDKLLKRIGEVEELSPHEQQNVTMYLNNILKENKYIKEIVDFNEQTVENLENLKSKFNNFFIRRCLSLDIIPFL